MFPKCKQNIVANSLHFGNRFTFRKRLCSKFRKKMEKAWIGPYL